MTSDERKCLRGLAACHTKREAQHRADGNDEAADCHKEAAAWYIKAASLPSGSQGGDGEPSTVNTNADGDAQAKRATEEIDMLLQKDRSAEFEKTPAADPITDLIAELQA